MDILSILPQPPAAPRVAGSPPTRGRPDPAKVPDRPDPAQAPTERADGQKEAIGQGQKTRQNLLDLLEDAVPGTKAALAGSEAKAVLGDISLPPTLDDMVKALAAIGVTLPNVTVQPTAPGLAQAIESADVSPDVKVALQGLVAAAAPVPASDVIALERPNPVPVPVTGRPVKTADSGPAPHADPIDVPAPHAEAGPAPHADQEPNVVKLLLKKHAEPGPAPASPSVPSEAAKPFVATAESVESVQVSVLGRPERSGLHFESGLAESLNLTEITAEEPEPVLTESAVVKGAPFKDSGLDSTALKVGTAETTPVPPVEKTAETQESDGPHPHADSVQPHDPRTVLGRPDRTAHSDESVSPKPHAELESGPRPKPKADGVPLGRPDRTAHRQDPAQALVQPAGEGEVKPVALGPDEAALKESGLESQDARPVDTPEPVAEQSEVKRTADPGPMSTASVAKNTDRRPLPKETVDVVHRQIADRIETMVTSRRSGSVTVKLNPTDLGSITLTVKSIGTRVDTDIKASNEDVRLALQAHRHDLVQNVESRGLTMNSFNVGQDAQPQGGQDHRAAFVEAQRHANLKTAQASQAETSAPKPTAYRTTTSGVDYLA